MKAVERVVCQNARAGVPARNFLVCPTTQHWQEGTSSFTRYPHRYHPHPEQHPVRLDTVKMLASRVAARSARAAAPRFSAVSVRGFADAAKVDSKPPVALFGLDGTYASALVRSSRRKYEVAGMKIRTE